MDRQGLTASMGERKEAEPADAPAAKVSSAVLLADLDALIAELQRAPVGGEALDSRIHFGFRVAMERCPDLGELLLREGVSWPTVQTAIETQVPPFTTSLDARLEGEAILFVLRAPRRGKWAAMQRTPHGEEILAWAATEPLARRLAAIKAWRAELAHAAARAAGNENGPPAKAGDAAKAPGDATGANKDWKVMF